MFNIKSRDYPFKIHHLKLGNRWISFQMLEKSGMKVKQNGHMPKNIKNKLKKDGFSIKI